MKNYYLAAIIIVLVAGVVIAGQAILGQTTRYDQQTVTDLNILSTDISNQVNTNHVMPVSLQGVQTKIPKSRLAEHGYEFHLLGSVQSDLQSTSTYTARQQYQLCASFKTDTMPKQTFVDNNSSDYFNPAQHTKGRNCFTDTVYVR